jgi:hypothetical protein
MVRQTLAPIDAPGPVAAATLTFVALDQVNFSRFRGSGKDLILVRNTTGAPVSVTFESAPDGLGRLGDIVKSVPATGAGGFAVFGPLTNIGWKQADGYVNIKAGATGLEAAIIRLD